MSLPVDRAATRMAV